MNTLQESLIEKCPTPLFEMMLERPAHMACMYGDKTDMDGVPDDTTGTDYEQLDDTARKYDSDNEEFEIL